MYVSLILELKISESQDSQNPALLYQTSEINQKITLKMVKKG